MARATPMLGDEGPFGPQLGLTAYNDVRFGLLGGSIVDSNALLRSYIWHCIGIPLVASIFMAVHFWRIRKDGGISGPAPVMLESAMKGVKKKYVDPGQSTGSVQTMAKSRFNLSKGKLITLLVLVAVVVLAVLMVEDWH